MSQFVAIDIRIARVDADKSSQISTILLDVIGAEPQTNGYCEASSHHLWYSESTFRSDEDFKAMAQEIAKQVQAELGEFREINFQVLYLENCPMDDFSVTCEQEVQTS